MMLILIVFGLWALAVGVLCLGMYRSNKRTAAEGKYSRGHRL